MSPFYLTFVVFPPGKYVLGSPDDEADRQTDERRHAIELTRSFAVSDREVTWAQYNPFQGVEFHDAAEKQFGRKLALDDPAFGANWFDAVNYCRWLTRQAGLADSEQCYADPEALEKDGEDNPRNWPLDVTKHGFRLPTEAEWEIACRGGTTTAYSFGNDVQLLVDYGWFTENAAKWSHGAGQLRPNPRGLFDLHGNLWEWCHDWYGSSFTDGAVDPLGAPVGSYRVSRGGGWYLVAAYCRAAHRDNRQPASRNNDVGFRLALSSVQ